MFSFNYKMLNGLTEWKYICYWPNRKSPADYREVLNVGLGGETPAYEELFHLATDPLEQHNLAGDVKHRVQLAAMHARCDLLLRETRGNPETLPTVSPVEWINEAPAQWKEVLPLLSARAEGQGVQKKKPARGKKK